MNLEKLFEMQRVLDEHIMNEHPELRGQNNLDWKILALQVELGECANEWRGFKKWSKNQEPRNKDIECHACNGLGEFHHQVFHGHEHVDDKVEICTYCDGTGIQEKNPLLTEYVDCLHFILSIGLEIGATTLFADEVNFNIGSRTVRRETLNCFNKTFIAVALLNGRHNLGTNYLDLFGDFATLGDSLGFTEEQIEAAYMDKNKVNHERQDGGY